MANYGSYREYGKRAWYSTSGWELSHFGGYARLIYDYPYVKFDFKAKIQIPNALLSDLGIYSAEKLIKMYLMKCKETRLLEMLEREETVEKSWTGEKRYEVLKLNNELVLRMLMDHFKEFAPLFNHYQEGILGTSIKIEVPPPGQESAGGQGGDEKQEGENQESDGGQGEDENQESAGGQGEDKDDNTGGGWGSTETKKPDFKALGKLLEDMVEQKPFDKFSSISSGCGTPKFITMDTNKCKDYVFTKEEMRNAEMILKQLDISFEPKSDEVKNLKLGKLDTSKLAEVPAGNISVYKQTLEDQDTKPFAVCILADMSGSMRGSRLDTQFKVLNSLYLALSEIIPVEDLHIYGHSGSSSEPKIYTFCNPYSPDYRKNIKKYHDIANSSNYDGVVIQEVHKKIREKTDRPLILISLSDGQPCDDENDMKKILEKARRDQFVTVGIGIGTDYVKKLYTYSRIVSDEKLEEMPREVTGIINHVVKTEFK
ncbi:VWA domain-containing protein [bacterium]|nr:VWA domain-containing protein [bacterium]